MNWRVNNTQNILRTGLIGILALFFFSCEESIEVTGDLIPDNDNVELRSVKLPLDISQVSYSDSIFSSNNVSGSDGRVYFGNYSDPEIGDIKAKSYFNFIAPVNFNRSTEIDSAYQIRSVTLNANVTYFYGREINSNHIVEVREIAEGDTLRSSGKTYTTQDSFDEGDVVNLESNFQIGPTDTTDFRTINIPLNTSVGERIIDNLINEDLSSEEAYNAFRGLSLATNNKDNIFGMNIAGGASTLTIIYQNASDTAASVLEMNLSSSSFTNVELTPGTVIPENYQNDLNFQLQDSSRVLFHQMLGINPVLDINDYLSFIDSLDYLQIQRAELVFGNELEFEEAPTTQIRPPERATPYVFKEDNLFRFSGDDVWAIQRPFSSNGTVANQSAGTLPTNFIYTENSQALKVDVTFFLQEIYNNRDFWVPSDRIFITNSRIPRNAETFSTGTTIYAGSFDHILADKEDVYINIYYVTFK